MSTPISDGTTGLTVSCVIRDQVAVLSVTGELDIDTGPLLYVHLANQLSHGRKHVIVDLSGVPFMDSSGLNVIIRSMRETRLAGGSLTLTALTPTVDKLFRLTGIGLTHPVQPDVESALATLDPVSTSSQGAP
ncbi:STAS domain-containing protein [Kitasatospora sp. NBC_01250]|uniref:STAS domain-containing protein n=1 Tax=unclassified Kitasatospora TaxID=2633591 RepID=UPI002E13A03F|nr:MULTISPECIES: STAS domain-containing protein [unclassified Kitasatospora]WSJ66727.1 STAS domain-containing protein [Kitasatospora sp. NBC_01302]